MVKTADELIKSMDDAYTQLEKGNITFPQFEELIKPLDSYYKDEKKVQFKRLTEYQEFQVKYPQFYQADECTCFNGRHGNGCGCDCRLAFYAEDKDGTIPGGDSQYLLDIIDAERKRFGLLKNERLNRQSFRGYLRILAKVALASPLAKVLYDDLSEQIQNNKKRKIDQCSAFSNTLRNQMRAEAKALLETTAVLEKAEAQLDQLKKDLSDFLALV